MSKIQIITDSASDISEADEKRCNISVLPFQVIIGDKSYTSRVDLTNAQFYELMEQYDEIPKTSQITPYEFQELYLKQAKAGVTDLILVLINSKGSTTYDNSRMAKDLFFEEHPEYQDTFHIYNIDGMGYSFFYGSPVVEAAKMLEQGASADEIAAYLTGILPRRQVYFGIYTLKYAGKSGRIPSAAAFIGDKLNLKPVMKIHNREVQTAAKCRGEHNLIAKIAELSAAELKPGTPYEVAYGSDPACLEEITEAMTKRLGYGPSAVYQIGAAIAANCGPKAVGVGFICK